jgi:hypothetical protein
MVAQRFEPEERGEFFLPPQNGTFATGAEHMMSVRDLFQHALQFSPEPLGDTDAEDLSDFVR